MASGQQITTDGRPARLDIREAGKNSVRITLKPENFQRDFPFTPAMVERDYPNPEISLWEITGKVEKQVGNLLVKVKPKPLTVVVKNKKGELIQKVTFQDNGILAFKLDDQPVLGMGEGGPRNVDERGGDWLKKDIEFDRWGRYHSMLHFKEGGAYGSRNPVPLLVGTGGWGLFIAHPWGQIDLRKRDNGIFIPIKQVYQDKKGKNQQFILEQGLPPKDSIVPGLYDLFVFDAHDPEKFMEDISKLTGPTVLPPKWALGYMQSHRTLENEEQMIAIVDSFRSKQIPIDAVTYLGTGFCPRGWNLGHASFEFNPEVFNRKPEQVFADLHDLHVNIIAHIYVPMDRAKLPGLCGSIPPGPNEIMDQSHMQIYWNQHVDLMKAGIDDFWPDGGDRYNLFEYMKRHQMYYQGPLATRPNVRPWSLHRNGYLGIARWGGWMWSGDIHSTWKTLEGQIAVGINYSLSLSPYWGSDIGGFFPTKELTGELYARWYQFGAFCPSFRSHGRTWWNRLPWGWGLNERGPLEVDDSAPDRHNPPISAFNNPHIEPIAKKYSELRYQLLPYTYTLAWQARETGMPLMRAMWLHYPDDEYAKGLGDQYLWGRDLLVAPVYKKGANTREVYLPEGRWYDWWTNKQEIGGQILIREVDLSIMPIYVRAGAIIPIDPIRQYTDQSVGKPTTLKVYRGDDGQFTLYEDDGTSLDYLDGEYKLTQISWDDSEQILVIKPGKQGKDIKDSYQRIFRGKMIPDDTIQEVIYKGKPVITRF